LLRTGNPARENNKPCKPEGKRMSWLRLILIALGSLLLIAVAGIAFLLSNPEQLREPVTGIVSKLLDRKLEINGEFDFELGRILWLRGTELRIANPERMEQGDFLNVAEVEATIDLTTVLDSPLVLPEVSIRSAELSLLQDAERRDNWTFGPDDAPEQPDDDEPGPGFLIRNIDVADGRIVLSLPALDEPVRLEIDSLTQRPREDGLLDAKLIGRLGGKPAHLHGQLGPFANLIALREVQLDLAGQFDSLSLSARGSVDDLVNPQAPSLAFSLAGPDVRDLAEMLGLGRAGEGEIDLVGGIRPTDGYLTGELKGLLGRSRIDVAARSAELLGFENASITVDLDAPNLGRALALFGVDDVPEEPFTLSGSVERADSLLTVTDLELGVADARFALAGTVERFPDLDGVRMILDVQGNDIARFRELVRLPGIASGSFAVSGEIDVSPEGNELVDVRLRTSLFDITASGPIGDPPGYVGTRLRLDARGNNFQALADALEIPDQRAVSFEITGELEVTERGIETREETVLRLGEQRLALNGLIGLKPLAADTDVRFRLYGNSTDALTELLDVDQFSADAPYEVSGRLRAQSRGFRLDGIEGQIGDAKFSVAGLITRDAQRIGSELRFDTSGPNLESVLADTAVFDVPPNPFRISGKLARRRNSIEISGLEVVGGRASLTAEIDIGWPFDADSSGEFAVTAEGPDLAAILPELDVYEPDAVDFAARAEGSWKAGLWRIDDFIAKVGGASLSASGTVDQPPDPVRTDLNFTLTIPDLSKIGAIQGTRLPETPFDVSAQVVDESGRFVIDKIDGRLADGFFNGKAILDLSQAVPDIQVGLRSPFLDLKPFLPDVAEAEPPDDEPDEPPPDGRVIPDMPLPLAELRRIDIGVDIDIEQLQLRTVTLTDVILDGSLRDGALKLERLEMHGPIGGGLFINASLLPQNGDADAALSMRGEQIRLNLFQESINNLNKLPVTDFTVEISGRGNSLRQLASSLDGSARFEARGGRIPNSGLHFLTGDFLLQVLQTLNPFVREEEYTGISCVVVIIDADDGLVTTAPAAVLQSDKLNIFVDGRFDLRRETLNFSFRSQPRRGISISISEVLNPFFQVTGTFADPALTLDPARVTVRGAAAVMTAGLSILAKAAWDRAFRGVDPCGAAIERADRIKSAEP
jgi:uncharacterized protein involved in outer membrane biogenesis